MLKSEWLFVDIAESTGKAKQHIQPVEWRAPNKLRRAIEPALYLAYAAWLELPHALLSSRKSIRHGITVKHQLFTGQTIHYIVSTVYAYQFSLIL